jgi:hypothetical protein
VSCRWKMSFIIARMFDKQQQHVGWETYFLKTKSVCHLYNPSRCVLLLKTVLSLGERYVQSVAMTTPPPSLCSLSSHHHYLINHSTPPWTNSHDSRVYNREERRG